MIKRTCVINISFDVDGIVADFPLAFTKLAREIFPEKGVVLRGCAGREAWGFKSLPGLTENVTLTLSNKEIDQIWSAIYSSPDFWRNIPSCFTNADLVMMHRMNDQHNICWVTSRSGKDVLAQTSDWLLMRGLPASNKVFIAGEDKAEFILKNLETDRLHIDDSPSQIIKLQTAGIPVIIRDWPYNRGIMGERVYSLEEFENVVRVVENSNNRRPELV